jgi:hypothetical protein
LVEPPQFYEAFEKHGARSSSPSIAASEVPAMKANHLEAAGWRITPAETKVGPL